MEIIASNQTVVSKVNEDISIIYSCDKKEGESLLKVSSRIQKHGETVGYFNSDYMGNSGLSFINRTSTEANERALIAAQVYADEVELFNN